MDKSFLESLEFLKSKTNIQPKSGIVLGTGLGDFVKHIETEIEIPYEDYVNLLVSAYKKEIEFI